MSLAIKAPSPSSTSLSRLITHVSCALRASCKHVAAANWKSGRSRHNPPWILTSKYHDANTTEDRWRWHRRAKVDIHSTNLKRQIDVVLHLWWCVVPTWQRRTLYVVTSRWRIASSVSWIGWKRSGWSIFANFGAKSRQGCCMIASASSKERRVVLWTMRRLGQGRTAWAGQDGRRRP